MHTQHLTMQQQRTILEWKQAAAARRQGIEYATRIRTQATHDQFQRVGNTLIIAGGAV